MSDPGAWPPSCAAPGSPTSTTRRWPGRSTAPTPPSTGWSPPWSPVPAAHRRAARRDGRRGPCGRCAGHHAWRRYVDRGQRGRPRDRGGHHPAPEPGARARRRGPHRPGAARHGARHPAAGGDRARAAVRARPVDAQPLHDRRDDRQQRVRVPGARLRPHRRQRRGARRAHRRRHPARRPRTPLHDRLNASSTPTSRGSGPSSAGSRVRSRATASSTCCRSGAAPTGSWSAARAPSRWSSVPPSGSSRTRPPVSSRCSATRHVRRRRRRARPAAPPAGRLRGTGPPDRRRGPRPARGRAGAAARRRLAVRRGHRRHCRRGRARPRRSPGTPVRSTYGW